LPSAASPKPQQARYDELVARFGEAPEPELRSLVAKALMGKAQAIRSGRCTGGTVVPT
jgi:hypothetical protein